jgi:hypothetical protein
MQCFLLAYNRDMIGTVCRAAFVLMQLLLLLWVGSWIKSFQAAPGNSS